MAEEIEKVKKEYEEKQKRKKDREKQSSKDEKDKEKDKKNDKDDSKDKDSADSKTNDEKERGEKVSPKEIMTPQGGPVVLNCLPFQIDSIKKETESKSDNSPRIFALHKYVCKHILDFLITH